MNVSLQKRERIEAIKASEASAEQKKVETNSLCRELRKVKNDILSVNDPKTQRSPSVRKEQRQRRSAFGTLRC